MPRSPGFKSLHSGSDIDIMTSFEQDSSEASNFHFLFMRALENNEVAAGVCIASPGNGPFNRYLIQSVEIDGDRIDELQSQRLRFACQRVNLEDLAVAPSIEAERR